MSVPAFDTGFSLCLSLSLSVCLSPSSLSSLSLSLSLSRLSLSLSLVSRFLSLPPSPPPSLYVCETDRDQVKKYSSLMLEKANKKQKRQRKKKSGGENKGSKSGGVKPDLA